MDGSDSRPLKVLEDENAKLKKLLAEQERGGGVRGRGLAQE
jgi:hypothetical protein